MQQYFKRIYKIKSYKLMEQQKKLFTYEFRRFNINTTISLTQKEEKIFSIIKSVIQNYKLTDLECRVAGGWVRDKVNLLKVKTKQS